MRAEVLTLPTDIHLASISMVNIQPGNGFRKTTTVESIKDERPEHPSTSKNGHGHAHAIYNEGEHPNKKLVLTDSFWGHQMQEISPRH